ncbi:chymotrypsinogen B-like [Daphnia pulex]|uniref:chymotrypsinogen B-like n=1 Tax=Daphnia pulex TaxID=6669 RepID=UPI001EE01D6D|nr:chymotrypsinogen B-like [Daphnia pulex]XP_046457840.1 chymotrypsinogen B-like [Daphnia pulex]
MSGHRLVYSSPVLFFFSALVTLLLSYCCISPASSFAFHPRVSRTDDAIIIDFINVEFAPSYYSQPLYGSKVAKPGFAQQQPFFDPYTTIYTQQRPSGWSYSYGYPSPNSRPTNPPPKTPSDVEYEEFFNSLLAVKQMRKCGRGPAAMPTTRALITERVAGGIDANKGAWPFMVALKNSDGSIFCTGTLLSDTKVLLAAQCLEKMSLFEMNGVTLLFGMHFSNLTDVQMTRRIGRVMLHYGYNALTYANDIAIVSLDAPVDLSRTVAPVCLPTASTDPDQFVDQPAVILGWGRAPGAALQNGELQQAKVSIMSNFDCKAIETPGKYVTDNTLCITSTFGNRYTCLIDVGGPVVTLPSPGAWTIVGINSYTKDCATNGLKTRVAAFRAWIDTHIK